MTQIEELAEIAKRVMEKYRDEYPDVKMDRDYIPFKVTEEWGECLKAYLMLSDRGRQKGMSKEKIKNEFANELADVFAYILLFADQEDVDIADALDNKWFSYLE